MAFLDEIQRDIERGMESDYAKTCTYNGYVFACSPSTNRQSQSLIAGGFEQVVSQRIVIRNNALDETGVTSFEDITAAQPGHAVIYDGTAYEIDSIDHSHGYITVNMKDPEQA